MENPLFFDDENIPLVTHYDGDHEGNHNDDSDEHNPPNTAVEETLFTTPSSINKQSTSTSQIRPKVKQDSCIVQALKCDRGSTVNQSRLIYQY